MKIPWRIYCKICDTHLRKDWWEYPEGRKRCKCPKCGTLNQNTYHFDSQGGSYSHDRVPMKMRCELCDYFEILDTKILKEGCTHFTKEHPDIMYNTSHFIPTGKYGSVNEW